MSQPSQVISECASTRLIISLTWLVLVNKLF